MGTETEFHHLLHRNPSRRMVKLNNPLMGTETSSCESFCLMSVSYIVKLNNPLMGTETSSLRIYKYLFDDLMLN